jgi:hypothetical protein
MSTPQNSNFGHFLRSQPGKKTRTVNYSVTPQSRGRKNSQAANQESSPIQSSSLIQPPVSTYNSAEEEVEEIMHPQVKIETFSGLPGEKGELWLKRYANICKAVFNYNDAKVQSTFPFHLVGQAKTWYESLSDSVTSNSDELVSKFLERFDGSDGGFAIGMVRQKTNESVHDYTTRFRDLYNGSGMPEKWIITNYVDGLLPNLRRIVKPQELASLEIARPAALRAEYSESDSVEVNAVTSNLTMDKKLDHLIELLTHQMHINLQQQQQQKEAIRPSEANPNRRQEATDFTEKGRNPYASRKQINHKCRICCETGHYEQNCPNTEEIRKIYVNSKSKSTQ